MNKLLCGMLLFGVLFGSYGYNGSTVSAVTLVGGIIKAQNIEISQKYKRKNCPICLGKGYYLSGDKITEVPCGYCEPDKTSAPAMSKPICTTGTCLPSPAIRR